jgi:lipopolysaccharide/colanic/teichoic acid biosynthesis glycosyltransferase
MKEKWDPAILFSSSNMEREHNSLRLFIGSMSKRMQLCIKRLLDICLALVALIILSPVYLAIACYVKLNSDGPVLFKQERAGLMGEPFMCYKFRTMTEDRGEDGELLPDEERLKSWGRRLRNSSLDELPQFVNILKGEISLIGPRALPVKYLPLYTDKQMSRHEMRPGMTSWTAVNGRNLIDWDRKFEMDVWYIDNWSLLLDCKILFRTFGTVLRKDGVSREGYATRDTFLGSNNETHTNAL